MLNQETYCCQNSFNQMDFYLNFMALAVAVEKKRD